MAESLHQSYLQDPQMGDMPVCSVHLDVVDLCSWPFLDLPLCRNTIKHLKMPKWRPDGDKTLLT